MVIEGEIYLGSDIRRFTGLLADADDHHQMPELTAREAQVFLLIARGHSVAKIAATVGINTKTAYGHRSNIYTKLQVFSDHELRQLAERRGLVEKR